MKYIIARVVVSNIYYYSTIYRDIKWVQTPNLANFYSSYEDAERISKLYSDSYVAEYYHDKD